MSKDCVLFVGRLFHNEKHQTKSTVYQKASLLEECREEDVFEQKNLMKKCTNNFITAEYIKQRLKYKICIYIYIYL